VDATGLHGFPVNIDRDGAELRGVVPTAFSATLKDTHHLAGALGNSGFDLAATSPSAGALEGQGSLAGRPFEVRLEGGTLVGRIGRCHITLKESNGVYVGGDSCAPQPIELRIPAHFEEVEPVEQALAIELVLAQIYPASRDLPGHSPAAPPALNTTVPHFNGRPRNF
jgi:hypothetical protein